MITHKNIAKIVTAMTALAVLACILAMIFPEKAVEVFGGTGVAVQYASELFDTREIIHIDIQMDEEEWEDMLSHAAEEQYYSCDVVINDEIIHHVGIRPKGNTSLSSIVRDPDTDRYSFKLEFDRYVDGQTCLGLDKLILNNNYADATNMKEALVYDMYQYLDADASLYNYAEVSVNGDYWGVYLALEAVEDSFVLRNYGTADSALYKPEGMGMGGEPAENGGAPGAGNHQPGREPGEASLPVQEDNANPPERKSMSEMPGGHFSRGSGGANLNYTDDDLDSYSTIWEGEVTDTGKSDHRRVVTALKHISQGTELEKYLDIDNVLRYMAVHVFSVNLDSLSGAMAHNYYLYEQDGQLNILPWDYNLAFGGMNMGRSDSDASDTVNDAIDTPFQSTRFFDTLLENEAYLSKYHEYLEKLTEEYVFGGGFEEFYSRVRSQIDTLVQTDPTAFYSYEEYEAGADMLYQTVILRAESIKGQLDGSIPSTDEGQQADSTNLIDASSVNIKTMGTMGGDRRENGRFPGRGGEDRDNAAGGDKTADRNDETVIRSNDQQEEMAQEVFRNNPAPPEAENGFSGDQESEDTPGNMEKSNAAFEPGNIQQPDSASDPGNTQQPDVAFNPGNMQQPDAAFNPGNMPQPPQNFGMRPGNETQRDSQTMLRNLALYGAFLLTAVLALLLAKRYHRFSYR